MVDNPLATPVVHNLVVNQTSPAAFGKVGIFTWGMSGGTPNGFRIQNLNLSPAGLAGNPDGLTNWTSVVPARANGGAALSGGNTVLDVSMPSGSLCNVLKSGNVAGLYNPTATNQSGAHYSESVPSTPTLHRLQLVP